MQSRWMRTLRLGIQSLLLHKLRSFLTILGLLFGVASVISMLAVGEGANYEALQQIKALGPTNVMVRSQRPPERATDAHRPARHDRHPSLEAVHSRLPSRPARAPT